MQDKPDKATEKLETQGKIYENKFTFWEKNIFRKSFLVP
jgi:hypothetical protein